MAENVSQTPFVSTFLQQFDALDRWLEQILEISGIVGAPARRARTRLTEMKDEVSEVCALIAKPLTTADLSKLTVYKDFDPGHLFGPELAKRADAGVQDLAAIIQDELNGIARGRKSELESKLVRDKPLTLEAMAIWQQMSACDSVEEASATLYRLAEAARFLYQTEFLRVISQATAIAQPAVQLAAQPTTGQPTPPPAAPKP